MPEPTNSVDLKDVLDKLADILKQEQQDSSWKHSMAECIARIDQRTLATEETLRELKEGYVTHTEFRPIRTLVYGFVGITMSSFILSFLYLVLK